MSEVKYLVVKSTKEDALNPYWGPQISNIEPQFIHNTVMRNTFLYSDDELSKFMVKNNVKSDSKTVQFYKVEQIYPRVEVTTKLSI